MSPSIPVALNANRALTVRYAKAPEPTYAVSLQKVTDKDTGNPISGATFRVWGTSDWGTSHDKSATTDTNGQASVSGVPADGDANWSVSKSGYHSAGGSIATYANYIIAAFTLTPVVAPEPTYGLDFRICDCSTWAALAGVTVRVWGTSDSGKPFDQTKVLDTPEGYPMYARFGDLWAGGYNFTASKAGYGSFTGSVRVEAPGPVGVNFCLPRV